MIASRLSRSHVIRLSHNIVCKTEKRSWFSTTSRRIAYKMDQIKIGIIGGSGLDNPDILESRKEKIVTTPFGNPSDSLIEGKVEGVDCVLLARHGRRHTLMPSNVNYRANIWALKDLGCTHLVVTTACGSLKEDIHPGDIVIMDQFIDRTTKRVATFYDGSENALKGVCHIPMHDPFCSQSRKVVVDVVEELGLKHHTKGTVITIEGPRFSTPAESRLFRTWGADIVNMTTVPEVVLAKELGLCYAAIAMVTDYDCWKETAPVSAAAVLEMFKNNVENLTKLLKTIIPKLTKEDWTKTFHQNQRMRESAVLLHPA